MSAQIVQPATTALTPEAHTIIENTPDLLPLADMTMATLFDWYRVNLCGHEIVDPRGNRIHFMDTDFIHLIKLVTKYGEEPKNRRLAIDQIRSGRIHLTPGRFAIRRAQELSWARLIAERPTMIVPNWQVMGKANPGDAYIKRFGSGEQGRYRVLVCGHEGTRRRAVTIFPRERFSDVEIGRPLWP